MSDKELFDAMQSAWNASVEKYTQHRPLFEGAHTTSPKGAPSALANKKKFKPATVKVDPKQQELFPEVAGTRMAKRKPYEEELHPREVGSPGITSGPAGRWARKQPVSKSTDVQLSLLKDEPDKSAAGEMPKSQKTLFEGASPNSSPKMFHWEPPTDIDPVKRQKHPNINTETQQHHDSTQKWNLRNVFRDHVAKSDMPDSHKTLFLHNIHQALKPMGREAIRRIHSNLQSVGVNQTPAHLTRYWLDHEHDTFDHPAVIEDEKTGEQRVNLSNADLPSGVSGHLGGYFNEANGTVHLAAETNKKLKDRGIDTHNIYMHELAHAADSPKAQGVRVSDDPKWRRIHNNSFSNGQLTDHAATDTMESLAEFARFAWTDPQKAKASFPEAYEYFEDIGWI